MTVRTRQIALLLLVAFALTACKSEEKKEEKAPKKTFEALISDGKPSLPAEVGAVEFWLSVEDFKSKNDMFDDDLELTLEGFDDIDASVSEFSGRVQSVYLMFTGEDALATLTEKWGAPALTAKSGDTDQHLWFNTEDSLRAKLEPGYDANRYYLYYETYIPAADVIGADGAKWGFEKDPIIGMTADEVKKSYAHYLDVEETDADKLLLPTTEYGRYATYLNLTYDDKTGKVQRFRISFPYVLDPAKKSEIEALLVAKYGDPLETDMGGYKTKIFFHPDTGTRAELSESADNADVSVGTYVPYLTIIGTEKGKMGFETTRLIGLSTADLKKDYGDAFEEASGFSLLLPRTEYGSVSTNVFLTLDGDTVTGYSTSIPYGDNDEGKDDILAAFKSAWGAPVEETSLGNTVYVFGTSPRFEVRDEDIIKAWRIHVK